MATGGKRDGAGRHPLPDDERLSAAVRIRLTQEQAAKLEELKARGHSARDLLLSAMRRLR